jgi:hypothetical protein
MNSLPLAFLTCFAAAEELILNGPEIPVESLGIRILLAVLGYLLPCLALIITGSIFDRLSAGDPATLWENTQAALLIIGSTALINILCLFLPIPPIVGLITYWGLIYFAFQLENLFELLSFIVVHGLILQAINFFITLPMLQTNY